MPSSPAVSVLAWNFSLQTAEQRCWKEGCRGATFVCLQIDKNCLGHLKGFGKGVVGDKALSRDNDERAETENERAAG